MEARPTPTIIPSLSSNRGWDTGIDTFNMTREELFELFERQKAKHPPKETSSWSRSMFGVDLPREEEL